jgi:ribonuclease E
MNVAEAFREEGIKAMGVSGETPKRELAEILAKYERGEIDVLVNAQLLAEGWNSPRATICMHLAPTASKRIYQQRVGRVTRRHPGKESGIVVDFVHPATRHDDPVVTLHSLLDRDVYRGGAIVVGPVRRGRGRRVRVERRVIPVTADPDKRIEVFERELWRIAVEFLDYGEQVQWAALAGARVAPSGWRRARAMLHFDKSGELKRSFLLTAVERNKNSQLRLRALQEIAQARDADAFERAVDVVRLWSRDERREGVKVLLQALAERRIGRRDQASHWIWDLADMTREVHEEYAVQRWPETKRLLGLLVNSSGGAHARNARRLVHASRKQDRRLSAALLAAAVAHTPEAMEVVRGARTRMARKPSALSRELLRNFPKRKNRSRRRRGKKGDAQVETPRVEAAVAAGAAADGGAPTAEKAGGAVATTVESGEGQQPKKKRRRSRRKSAAARAAQAQAAGNAEAAEAPETGKDGPSPSPAPVDAEEAARGIEAAAALLAGRGMPVAPPREEAPAAPEAEEAPKPKRRRTTKKAAEAEPAVGEAPPAEELVAEEAPKPARRRRTPTRAAAVEDVASEPAAGEASPVEEPVAEEAPKPARRRRTPTKAAATEEAPEAVAAEEDAPKKPARRRTTKKAAAVEVTSEAVAAEEDAPKKPARRTTKKKAEAEDVVAEDAPKPTRRRAAAKKADAEASAEEAPKPTRRRAAAKKADADAPAEEKPKRTRRTPVKAAEPEQLSLDEAAAEAPKARRSRRKADDDQLDDAA